MADRISLDPSEASAAPAQAKGGLKAFLPLAATLLIMPAAAWAMTTFVLIPKLQKSLGVTAPVEAPQTQEGGDKEAAPKTAKDAPGAKQSVSLTKLLVNVAGTMGSRYLLASVMLSGASADFKAKVEKHEPQLRDMACTVLATKTITDLEKPGARNLVRSELLTGFNNILGGNIVQEIFITEFAIQ